MFAFINSVTPVFIYAQSGYVVSCTGICPRMYLTYHIFFISIPVQYIVRTSTSCENVHPSLNFFLFRPFPVPIFVYWLLLVASRGLLVVLCGFLI